MGGTDSATPTLTAAPFPEQAPAGLGITPGQGTDLPPPWKGAEWKVKGESLTGGKERGWWRASMLMPLFKPSLALLGNDVLGKGEQRRPQPSPYDADTAGYLWATSEPIGPSHLRSHQPQSPLQGPRTSLCTRERQDGGIGPRQTRHALPHGASIETSFEGRNSPSPPRSPMTPLLQKGGENPGRGTSPLAAISPKQREPPPIKGLLRGPPRETPGAYRPLADKRFADQLWPRRGHPASFSDPCSHRDLLSEEQRLAEGTRAESESPFAARGPSDPIIKSRPGPPPVPRVLQATQSLLMRVMMMMIWEAWKV